MSRHLWILATLAACGGKDPALPDAPVTPIVDAPACQPQSAIGSFYRRQPNPRLIAGTHTFTDGKLDTSIADPDLHWDEAGQLWHLYYMAAHATAFNAASVQTIRHATSPDLVTWTLDDAPALAASSDGAAWDHLNTETPSIAINRDASADHRYLMVYSGAKQMFPGYGFADYAIGAAFSADGVTYTRVPAAQSPHAADGLVLTGADAYPGAGGAIVADPEVAYVGGVYHLWFSSFACSGASCATATDYGIGHATSSDGIHWSVAQAPVLSLLRASIDPNSGGGQPSVLYDALHCRWEMWLTSDATGDHDAQPVVFNNMAGVWHATSTDASTWTVNFTGTRDLTWTQTESGEHLGLLTGVDVAMKSTGRYMVYVGFDDQSVPSGFFLPDHSASPGYESGVMTLGLATRDAP